MDILCRSKVASVAAGCSRAELDLQSRAAPVSGAAKIDWQAAQFQDKDQRNAVIQDVALTYAELAKWEARLARLQDYEAEARKLEQAVTARLQEAWTARWT